jgi:hypothetical protein
MKELGSLLRGAREKKGLSVQEVHAMTRIALDRIEMIEKGEWDDLPLTYYRSFVRSLADLFELNSQKLLDEWQSREYDEPVVVLEEDLRLVSAKNYRSLFRMNQSSALILAIVAGIIAIALIGVKIGNRYFTDPSRNGADSTAAVSDSLLIEDTAAVPDPFVVTIRPQKDMQLLVQLDRSPSLPVQVKKDRISQWRVEQSLQIVLEYPEPLEILMDGQPLVYELKAGVQNPRLKITRDGIEVRSR